MKKDLLKVSIRQHAIYLPAIEGTEKREALTSTTVTLVAQLRKVGYSLSEELLHAVNQLYPAQQVEILQVMKEVLGVSLNWAPLVKGWDTPTGETRLDHWITWLANMFNSKKGVKLSCGHVIPDNTFPLERYNGCPFCGTPFETASTEYFGQASKLKVLELWQEKELNVFFGDLLESRTALDATQADSLKILLAELPLPAVGIKMKETLMLVIDTLVEQDRAQEAQIYFSAPNDILRYLWYKKTGFLQIIEPKTLIRKAGRNNAHLCNALDKSRSAAQAKREELKLKYTRRECKMVALWLNNLAMTPEKSCEMMHSKREMWVRMIRALRLAEYARKPGFENLKELMDVFYCQAYTVWQGEVERSRLKADATQTFALLKQRPGMFARSLFANMLWFGPEETLTAFKEVVHLLPARLVVTLGMYAESYFEQGHKRMVKPLGGNALLIEPHYLVSLYMEDQLKEMVKEVQDLCKEVVAARFANAGVGSGSASASMYIDPMLFHIPLSIGDRSETVQDTSCALQGTRFPVEGDKVRLFMQWGKGLPAQHLDMDLSCHITLPSTTEVCSYFNLTVIGAKHSGDIRSIPDKKGTAEYIELDLNELSRVGAQYVAFTCNAYSNGAISPNLVVGWMNSAYPMKISERNGVAYDPSCVQHQVRVSQSVQKGLVFGVLKVKEREVVWLEIPFGGQTVLSLDTQTIEKYLDKLEAKTTVGELLAIKAQAQGLKLADTPEADEVYTREWALNTAAVTKLLLGD